MGKKKQNSSIGRSLIKDRFGGGRKTSGNSHLHTSELEDGYDWNRINFKSVTEENTLDEFLATAEMAGTEFTAEKLNVKIVSADTHSGLLSVEEEARVKDVQSQHITLLKVPRRPTWDELTTASELDQRERESFLEWRRQLAELQEVEGLILTPFEKNLDFWRQLWRVIERSDVVVQIVDARNPLLFRCEDLESYVKEVDPTKINMILVNKADHLSPKQRVLWAEYFDKAGLKVAFWSATLQSEKNKELESEHTEEEDMEEEYTDDSSEEEEDEEEEDEEDDFNNEEVEQAETSNKAHPESKPKDVTDAQKLSELSLESQDACSSCDKNRDSKSDQDDKANIDNSGAPGGVNVKNSPEILDGEALLHLLKTLHTGDTFTPGVTTVGMVGYPNVGKSSTINAICQSKCVPVSATPGRTKHFQTVFIERDLMLCDCPGLVMPTFVSTKAHMVLNGILPIDQMRDYVPPSALLSQQIGRSVLETIYGILLPRPQEGEDENRPATAHEFLGAHACMRGFMTHKGIPDFQKSARLLLKDYVNGKLLYCQAPPDVDDETFCPVGTSDKSAGKARTTSEEHEGQPLSRKKGSVNIANQVDSSFFAKSEPRAGSKGIQGVIGFSRREGFTGHHSSNEDPSGMNTPHSSTMSLNEKPWKRHNNKHKKEKLRRMTSHLDA